MSSILFRQGRKWRSNPAPLGGLFSRFAPVYATLPTGITFSSITNRYIGAVIDTREPAWAATDATLTDSGTASTNMQNLNSLLASVASSAVSNTRIIVPAGVRYAGTLTLPVNNTGFWIGIVTSGHASLPARLTSLGVGTKTQRVADAHKAFMPEFYPTANNVPVIEAANTAAQKYFMRGLYLTNRNLVTIDGGMVQARTNYPRDLTFTQFVVDGGSYSQYVRRPFFLGGVRLAVDDCFIDKVGQVGSDSQAVLVGSGAGPYRFNNSYSCVGGPSENWMSGGLGLDGTDDTHLPRDIEVRGNFLDKPVGQGAHKNHVEVKFGRRILIEGNVMGHHNGQGQPYSVNIKLTDQYESNTGTDTSDIIIANNDIRGGPGGITVVGAEGYSGSNATRRIDILNNRVRQLTTGGAIAAAFGSGQNATGVHNVNLQWNTLVGGPAAVAEYAKALMFNNNNSGTYMQIRNNVLVGSELAYQLVVHNGEGGGAGETAFANSFPTGSSFAGNLISCNLQSFFPNQVRTATDGIGGVGFVDYASGNYALSGSSVGKGSAADGNDMGCDITDLDSLITGVL